MKTTHTNGEWKYIKYRESDAYEIESLTTNHHIATIHNMVGSDSQQKHANAKLIAAAPFLLKTLIDMTEMESTPKHLKKYALEAINKTK